MTSNILAPADILLPKDVSMEKWSVIACDQFSSERDYWERVRENVGNSPSTLNLIIPEAYLDETDEHAQAYRIGTDMASYMDSGLFQKIVCSMVYVERTLPDGRIRRGIIGAADLEAYDFTCSDAEIRASEGTVLDRLPPRIHIRRNASLELPHIMTFIDDRDDILLGSLAKKAKTLPVLYDFDLMEGGGHIKGMRVTGQDAEGVMAAVGALRERYDVLMVLGDGNHSLAAAKVYWNELKETLSDAEREVHPARRALIEVNNVYDEAIDIEAIHRVIFDVAPEKLVRAFKEEMPSGTDYMLRYVSRGQSGEIGIGAACIGDMLSVMQEFLDNYEKVHGCRIDYIHGEDSVLRLSEGENCLGLILPAMEKSELFETVAARGVFPKKSFSVGHARDKRYYLECREITNGKVSIS